MSKPINATSIPMTPISFTAFSIRAMQLPPETEARKTQTRRLEDLALPAEVRERAWQPGSVRYVKESWATFAAWDSWSASEILAESRTSEAAHVWYPAGGCGAFWPEPESGYGPGHPRDDYALGRICQMPKPPMIGRIRPQRFMPTWVARLAIVVESSREERLRDITEEDARAEGAIAWMGFGEATWLTDGQIGARDNQIVRYHRRVSPGAGRLTARDAFAAMWDQLHGEESAHSWDANPMVRVVAFRLVKIADLADLVRSAEGAKD